MYNDYTKFKEVNMSKICCRDCVSPNCEGCNVYTLYMMLETGKFERLMNGNRAIMSVEARPNIRSFGGYNKGDNIPYCDNCGMPQDSECNYCPSCGADMRGK